MSIPLLIECDFGKPDPNIQAIVSRISKPASSIAHQIRPHYLRFRVKDRPGIIAKLASILAAAQISLDAVLQQPSCNKEDLPFVITAEPTTEKAVRDAVDQMKGLDFLVEDPLALPLEAGLDSSP